MYQEEFWNQRDVPVLYRNILMLKMKRDLVLQCFISVLSYKSILCTFLNLLIYRCVFIFGIWEMQSLMYRELKKVKFMVLSF